MIKEFLEDDKPTSGKIVAYRRLDEAIKPSDLMAAKPTKTERRYKVTLTFKVGAHRMWWQTTLTADDRDQAIRMGRDLLQKDLIRAKSIGYSIEFAEALLVDKTQS